MTHEPRGPKMKTASGHTKRTPSRRLNAGSKAVDLSGHLTYTTARHLIDRELGSAMVLWGNQTANVANHILGVSGVKATPASVQLMKTLLVATSATCQNANNRFSLEG